MRGFPRLRQPSTIFLMKRITLYLNDAEHAWVMAQAQEADVTPAAFLRGLIAYAGADKVRRSGVGIVQEAQRMARTGITLTGTHRYPCASTHPDTGPARAADTGRQTIEGRYPRQAPYRGRPGCSA